MATVLIIIFQNSGYYYIEKIEAAGLNYTKELIRFFKDFKVVTSLVKSQGIVHMLRELLL